MRAGAGNADRLHFVDAPALTPTLSRKREREHPAGDASARVQAGAVGFPGINPVSSIVPTPTTASSSVQPRACP
ncbi:protein of unknown function [Cupriavidus taiwanensis]|nr:hypothetical protein CBM2606_A90475 [Cupriavidus taiwanensis]SPA41945.1 protein of unknown function [Cupriavidus taiwanensis]